MTKRDTLSSETPQVSPGAGRGGAMPSEASSAHEDQRCTTPATGGTFKTAALMGVVSGTALPGDGAGVGERANRRWGLPTTSPRGRSRPGVVPHRRGAQGALGRRVSSQRNAVHALAPAKWTEEVLGPLPTWSIGVRCTRVTKPHSSPHKHAVIRGHKRTPVHQVGQSLVPRSVAKETPATNGRGRIRT